MGGGLESLSASASFEEAVLAKLREDHPRRLLDAVEGIGQRLAKGELTPEEAGLAGEELARLAGHSRWEIRKAVADAASALRHDTAHAIVAQLVDDNHGYVRLAAERALSRHDERNQLDYLKEQHAAQLEKWLDDLEKRPGTPTREAVIETAMRYAEVLVREASHELAQPIKAAAFALENIGVALSKEQIDRPAALAKLARAKSRVRFVHTILRSLREFSARQAPVFATENVRELVREAVGLVRETREDRRRVKVVVAIDPALTVEADRGRIVQAFRNLVQNAFDAFERTSPPRKLKIEARVERRHFVVLSFTDNGAGMSEEMRLGAFRLFVTSKPVGTGTGFGLPLAKKILVGEHRGSISLASKRGKGTTVTVTLPVQQAEARGASSRRRTGPRNASGRNG